MSSCRLTKESVYLKTLTKDTTITGLVSNDFESKIQKGDQLSIMVTSLSSAEDEQFNKAAAVSSSPAMNGFLVYPDGKVLLHRLGRYTADGLTRRQLATALEKDLLPFMKDPIVNVGYLNHKVTIIGEVGQSQVLALPEEQMNIFDVLVKSGDISEKGMKDKVMIIREEGNTKTVKHLNLEDHAIFTSPWYYIKPNDIILVKADFSKVQKEERRRQLQTNMALVASGLSLFIIIVDRIIR